MTDCAYPDCAGTAARDRRFCPDHDKSVFQFDMLGVCAAVDAWELHIGPTVLVVLPQRTARAMAMRILGIADERLSAGLAASAVEQAFKEE